MAQIFLSLGSNINQQENITLALKALVNSFDLLRVSSIYQTAAVGFDGDDFFNLLVAAQTKLSPSEINQQLKSIEVSLGRDHTQKGFHARTIDIDLLTYGDYVGELDGITFPRDEIKKYAFVMLPLVEVAGEQICPGEKLSYIQLWKAASEKGQWDDQHLEVLSFAADHWLAQLPCTLIQGKSISDINF